MVRDTQRAIEVLEFINGKDRLPKAQLRTWVRSTDPDVLGAVCFAATHHWSRIEPAITRLEFGHLLARVVAVALRKKGATHFSLSNYQALRTLGGWILECFKDRANDPEAERSLRWGVTVLASLYKGGGRSARRCVVDGSLEHLLAVDGIAAYFKNWERDKVLARAYREAMECLVDPSAPLKCRPNKPPCF